MEDMCFRVNITRYLNHCKCEKGLDDNTLKAYRIDLTQYCVYSKNDYGGADIFLDFSKAVQETVRIPFTNLKYFSHA